MSTDREDDLQWFRNNNVQAIKELLLKGLSTGSFDHLRSLSPWRSHLAQLEEIFAEIETEHREKMKSAVELAVSEWHPTHYEAQVLKLLMFLGGYLRASQVVPAFRSHLALGLSERLYAQPYAEVVATGLAVVSGFPFHPEAGPIFRQYFAEATYNPQWAKFAAQLFVGSCKCDASVFAKHLPVFLNLVRRYPEFYTRLDLVFLELVRTIGLAALLKTLLNLDLNDQQKLTQILITGESALLSYESDGRRQDALRFRPPRDDLLIRLGDLLDDHETRALIELIHSIRFDQISILGTTPYIEKMLHRELDRGHGLH